MASPVISTVQEHIYRECLQRVEELIVQAYIDLQDIESKYKRHITNNLEYFGITLGIIKHRARTYAHGKHQQRTRTRAKRHLIRKREKTNFR